MWKLSLTPANRWHLASVLTSRSMFSRDATFTATTLLLTSYSPSHGCLSQTHTRLGDARHLRNLYNLLNLFLQGVCCLNDTFWFIRHFFLNKCSDAYDWRVPILAIQNSQTTNYYSRWLHCLTSWANQICEFIVSLYLNDLGHDI